MNSSFADSKRTRKFEHLSIWKICILISSELIDRFFEFRTKRFYYQSKVTLKCWKNSFGFWLIENWSDKNDFLLISNAFNRISLNFSNFSNFPNFSHCVFLQGFCVIRKMSYYYDSSSDGYCYGSDDYDDSDDYMDCSLCDAQVKNRNYQSHLEKVHKCPHCTNYMPKESISGHIERKHTAQCRYCPMQVLDTDIEPHERSHFVKCKLCSSLILRSNLNQHTAESHPFRATIGMIRLEKLTDHEFNEMVRENRIYAKDGHIFIK